MPTIDEYSAATCPIEMFFGDTYLSLGTAFSWQVGDQHYLITNWHNLTGINPLNGRHLSNSRAEPNRIKVWYHANTQLGNRYREFVTLYDDDGQPLWLVHPQHGNKIDVVALPVPPHPDVIHYPINKMSQRNLNISVGVDLFILGYPYGIARQVWPIWKRASIATEPEIFGDEEKYVLVDTASRPGMSGSPAILRAWGSCLLDDGSVSMVTGSSTRIFGVYSGRLESADPLDAQLGMVWPIAFVDEIIAGTARDTK
ncbi:MAG: trypsin-like peptidase domain-containing protein [Proteobacteria bacterium]|nr:trypsin-like peptidase domain-containing protein [Pseudomonadota bacterium]